MRDHKIDALKALAMFLVIVGHAIVFTHLFGSDAPGRVAIGAQWIDRQTLDSFALNLAYSVHMPLFSFLSAYVLLGREGTPLALVGKRVLSLMVPYVAWVLVSYAIQALRSGGSLSAAASYLGTRLLYPQSPGAAWFLYALFGCFAVFAVVRALGGRDRLLIASAVVVGGLIVVPFGTVGDIFGVYDVAWLYPFFVMGYLFAKHRERLARRRSSLLIAGIFGWAALLPFIWPVLVPEVNWWYPVLREWLHARGIPGAVVLLYAVRYACAGAGIITLFYAYDWVKGRALYWQAWVGRRTLGMYLIQPYVLTLVAQRFTDNVVVLTAAAFVGSLALTWVLERGPVTRSVLLGQRLRRKPRLA